MTRRAFLARAAACTATAVLGSSARAQTSDKLDLVIRGGTVIDPASGIQARADIGLRAGRIAAIEPEISVLRAARVIEASGKLVTPGLIDLHAPVYAQTIGGVLAQDPAGQTAVTTCVSAGEASVYDLAGFRRHAARYARCRVYAFVHLAATGSRRDPAATAPAAGEADVAALGRVVAQNRDLVIGVTVHPAVATEAGDDIGALERAIAVVEAAQTRGRIMCNIAGMRQDAGALLERLRPGDILTHAYSPARHDLMAGGKLNAAALAARKRGVIIDVGHGVAHFDAAIARAAIAQGLAPDVISSGLATTQAASQAAPQLTTVMSKFLNLGFSVEQVVAMTTVNPARLIGREAKLGTLDLGAPGEISILELAEAPIEFTDAGGARWMGTRSFKAVRSIRTASTAPKDT